jgi:hypothetical protein
VCLIPCKGSHSLQSIASPGSHSEAVRGAVLAVDRQHLLPGSCARGFDQRHEAVEYFRCALENDEVVEIERPGRGQKKHYAILRGRVIGVFRGWYVPSLCLLLGDMLNSLRTAAFHQIKSPNGKGLLPGSLIYSFNSADDAEMALLLAINRGITIEMNLLLSESDE